MLQFITNENSSVSPSQQVLEVIDGGCRWIQIRLKDASDEEIRKLFFEIREKAKETLSTIIINDRVELAKSLGADGVAGVHLGMDDMPASEARALMGPEAIIGVTAHSFEEADSFRGLDVDYIGVGPYSYTETKKNLAPILGLEGISEIMRRVKESDLSLPIVAVGGIRKEDVKGLLDAGVNGIAVSGAIANSDNLAGATSELLSLLPIDY